MWPSSDGLRHNNPPTRQFPGACSRCMIIYLSTIRKPTAVLNVSTLIGGGIDLSLSLELRSLHIQLTPAFPENLNSSVLVEEMLTAWTPQYPSRLQLSAYKYHQFTRQGFADILRTLGPIIDAWIPQPSPASNSKNDDCLNYKIDIRIHESEAWRQWWRDCMSRCFPTWVRLKRLHIDFRARKCLKS